MGENIVRALFWTLAHSLWQGLVLALLTGLAIVCTRRSRPALRYNIFLGLFCLFLVTAGITFLRQMSESMASGDVPQQPAIVFRPVVSAGTAGGGQLYALQERSWMEVLVQYFNDKSGVVVTVWAIILFIRLVRLTVHLGTLQRLRYYKAFRADELWQERVKGLAVRLGIRKEVELLESSIVRIPMMVGVFKPVILVPLGLVTQLPPQQLEAILLHELAHIRRKDYIVNMLQSFAEVLFFFNPAVLWIASLIREERENCCDDIAVEETSDKKDFVHALVSFQEYKQASGYALAFPGSKNHLLDRVKRIIHHDNKTLNMREKLFLLVCLFTMAGLTMAYTRFGQPKARKGGPAETVKSMAADTMRGLNDTVPRQAAGKKKMSDTLTFIGQFDMGDTVLMFGGVDGDREARLADRERRLAEAEKRLAVQSDELETQQARLNELYAEQMARLQDLRNSLHNGDLGPRLLPDSLRLRQLDKVALDKNQRLAERVYDQNQLELDDLRRQYENNSRLYERQMEEQKRNLEVDHVQHLRELEEAKRKMAMEQGTMELRAASSERMRNITPIIDMLADRKLIDVSGDFSFSLDKNALTVNGKKQPDEVFQVFKEAFIDDPRDYVRYTKKGGSESSSVSMHGGERK